MKKKLIFDKSDLIKFENANRHSRRGFLQRAGLLASAAGAAVLGLPGAAQAADSKAIEGFEKAPDTDEIHKGWKPFSDKKIRVGLVGYGVCKFSVAFGFQNHPNVEIAGVSDLFPDRVAELSQVVKCDKKYAKCEDMVRDTSNKIDAVFLATDAPSHARLAIDAMEHGKHVGSCVPAVFGSLEDADKLLATVKRTGLKYMMFETSAFHEDLYAMRQLYNAGAFGKLIYTEGEYYHYQAQPYDSYKGWRIGLAPQWYPTHSNAYYICVTGGSFTEVSCLGMKSIIDQWQPQNNKYKNPFGTEAAMFRTSEGGMARMTVSWDAPGFSGEMGRVRGQRGTYYDTAGGYEGLEKKLPNLKRPALPPAVPPGGHGGGEGQLMNEFVTAIINDRKPLVDVGMALNLTVAGIIADRSARKDGELLKIPQYKL